MRETSRTKSGILAAAVAVATALSPFADVDAAEARDRLSIVGSSTVFPFAARIAEQHGKNPKFKPPMVRSTGSGGGFKLFCAGVGVEHPDIVNASRRIKKTEFERCQANGVDLVEIRLGYDGIVLANASDGPRFELTREQIWKAIAKVGPRPERWSEISPDLPDVPIKVLGPPPSSGTRDAFEELAVKPGCLKAGGKPSFCDTEGLELREDGLFVEAGENDNVIVAKLRADPERVGVFGYSFLERNLDTLRGAGVENFPPTRDVLMQPYYPFKRMLYVYLKKDHINLNNGLAEFLWEVVSPRAQLDGGYLAEIGLIPLAPLEYQENRRNALAFRPLSAADF